MLEVTYIGPREGLMIDGSQTDFEQLTLQIRALFDTNASEKAVEIPVISTDATPISGIVVQRGPGPNCVSFEAGRVVISIAPTLLKQFLSFINFTGPVLAAGDHTHYEYIGQDQYISPDSLPVIFSLK